MTILDILERQFPDLDAAERALIGHMDAARQAAGPVRLEAGDSAQVRGVVLAAVLVAQEAADRRGRPLHLDGWRISGALALDDLELRRRLVFERCAFADPVSADCAHLGGLEFRDCTLGAGLSAREARIEADLALYACKVSGAVALESVRIAGDFDCRRSVLRQGDGTPPVETGDDKALKRREPYRRDELVNLVGAHVEGRVRFDAIDCDGRLRLTNIRVGGDVDCWSATFTARGEEENGLILTNALVEEKIIITNIKVTPRTVLKFDYSRARLFQGDGDQVAWPETGRLGLEGFSFDFVSFMVKREKATRPDNRVISADVAIAWLERLGPLFHRQPYMQIARVFRDQGYLNESIAVLIAQEEGDRRRRGERYLQSMEDAGRGRLAVGLARWLLPRLRFLNPWRIMRYGYRPLNAVYVLAALFAVGVVLFGQGHAKSLIVPARDSVYLSDRYDPAVGVREPMVYPEFNPWLYSLDTLVPVFQLGQEEHWQPNARTDFSGAVMRADAPDPWHERPFRAGTLLNGYLYLFHIPMGWLFSVLFFAGISRRLQVG